VPSDEVIEGIQRLVAAPLQTIQGLTDQIDGLQASLDYGPCALPIMAGSWLVLMALFFPSHHRRRYYQHQQPKCAMQSPPKLVYGPPDLPALSLTFRAATPLNWYY
jgi:hypothetical protein